MSKILEDLLYSDSHEWVKVDGDVAIVGVSDFAQAELGDITYVDVPAEGDTVTKGEDFGALESVKASGELRPLRCMDNQGPDERHLRT